MEIHGLEIFRVGKWNGDTYTHADLDAMVDAFGKVGYRPPVTLGHVKDVGARAWGWVKALRRVGDKLVADLTDIPDALYAILRDRGYDAVSAEVYFNLERNGKRFARALKALALLGAETPGVAGLQPIRSVVMVALDAAADETRAYEFAPPHHEEDSHMTTFEFENPSAEADRLAREYMFNHNEKCYSVALHAVLDHMPALKRAYASTAPASPMAQAHMKVHSAAMRRMDSGCRSYAQALREALADEPTLARVYGLAQ